MEKGREQLFVMLFRFTLSGTSFDGYIDSEDLQLMRMIRERYINASILEEAKLD
jgi:hypothetical protein